MIKIAILDYGVGNLFSIQTALKKLGVTTIVTSELDRNLEYDDFIKESTQSIKSLPAL